MTNLYDNKIKVNRALTMSQIGNNPASAAAMLAAIPNDVILALPSRMIAQILDANWRLAQNSKAIALRDALSDGAIWDGQRSREIAP